MGLSDKPDDDHYAYTLQSRVDDLERLLDRLGLTGNITLAVHDWGGMIGFGWALRTRRAGQAPGDHSTPRPSRCRGPKRCRGSSSSAATRSSAPLLIRGFNAFAGGATRFGVIDADAGARCARAYNAPYD